MLGTLKKLPTEIRNHIYHDVFSSQQPVVFRARVWNLLFLDCELLHQTPEQKEENRSIFGNFRALCASSPQILAEAKPVFFDVQSFKLETLSGDIHSDDIPVSGVELLLSGVRNLILERWGGAYPVFWNGNTPNNRRCYHGQIIKVSLRGDSLATTYLVETCDINRLSSQSLWRFEQHAKADTSRILEMAGVQNGLGLKVLREIMWCWPWWAMSPKWLEATAGCEATGRIGGKCWPCPSSRNHRDLEQRPSQTFRYILRS